MRQLKLVLALTASVAITTILFNAKVLFTTYRSKVDVLKPSKPLSHTGIILENTASDNKRSSAGQLEKLILLYTPLFGQIPWPFVTYNYSFTDSDGTACTVHKCKVTYHKVKLSESDLIIFHGRDLPPDITELIQLSSAPRTDNQAWVFFMHESPINTHFNRTEYNGIFNWTATYRADSDITVLYHYYGELGPNDNRPKQGTDFAKGKDQVSV